MPLGTVHESIEGEKIDKSKFDALKVEYSKKIGLLNIIIESMECNEKEFLHALIDHISSDYDSGMLLDWIIDNTSIITCDEDCSAEIEWN